MRINNEKDLVLIMYKTFIRAFFDNFPTYSTFLSKKGVNNDKQNSICQA
jgi:hypothetical protein